MLTFFKRFTNFYKVFFFLLLDIAIFSCIIEKKD